MKKNQNHKASVKIVLTMFTYWGKLAIQLLIFKMDGNIKDCYTMFKKYINIFRELNKIAI